MLLLPYIQSTRADDCDGSNIDCNEDDDDDDEDSDNGASQRTPPRAVALFARRITLCCRARARHVVPHAVTVIHPSIHPSIKRANSGFVNSRLRRHRPHGRVHRQSSSWSIASTERQGPDQDSVGTAPWS
jgi:hypothetical protein